MFDKIDEIGVNTIRTLSIDEIQRANSGHPGLPMGAAPMAYVLWTKHLKVNPKTSMNWVDRDRFILSAGHGSSMLYSLLHLAGYNVSIDDLKNFRQWGSITPGHPEVHHTDGVEATTGPLGQGVAMAVGMAMAEAHLAASYNRNKYNIVNHYTYALCGDGDLMEGVSSEASSMAGHMKLGKLILLYDSNDISLDGPTSKSFTENISERYLAYGWQYLQVRDGNDLEAISAAIDKAKADTSRPTIIEIKTIIGYGSSKAGTSAVHGAPLGEDEIRAIKKTYDWKYPNFVVPDEVTNRFTETMINRGREAEDSWNQLYLEYKQVYPELAKEFEQAFKNELPKDWDAQLPVYETGTGQSSRVSSGETVNLLSKTFPNLWGGSADLSGPNSTLLVNEKDFEPGNYEGKNIWFGVREFAMAATMNGIQLHGGTRVYGGTFFAFIDYLRPALRLAALMRIPVIYVLTHDSVAIGEDGPTHEPIEQLASVRCIPNVQVIRPADANETVAAWKMAMQTLDKPTILVLTRQDLSVLPGTKELAGRMVGKGAYTLSPQKGVIAEGILIASGSEVNLALQTQTELAKQGKDVSVVSMPSFDLFEQQDVSYKDSVFPQNVTKRLAIEAASPFGWERYANQTVAINHFGTSAPSAKVLEAFGFSVKNVLKAYKEMKDR